MYKLKESSVRKALITGSNGPIGSACVLASRGWSIAGMDNNLRQQFFGPKGSTLAEREYMKNNFKSYHHMDADIRDRAVMMELFSTLRPDFVFHTAAHPSHDRAAEIPEIDFDVNAVGTFNLLFAAKTYCPESPFCFTPTNKVYGDRPNFLALQETETRYDYAHGCTGIDESMSIDQCLHSRFGASKVAADVACQGFGRYFHMPVGIFRGGCLTGPQQAAVELHGYLAYIVHCAVTGKPYTIFGHKGKQVRDQIHCDDVASLFYAFYERPRPGEVFNLGGGLANSLSILETIQHVSAMGQRLDYFYSAQSRVGDHICCITALANVHSHYPEWNLQHTVSDIIQEIVANYESPQPLS